MGYNFSLPLTWIGVETNGGVIRKDVSCSVSHGVSAGRVDVGASYILPQIG